MRYARGEAILRVIAMRYAPQLIVSQNEAILRRSPGTEMDGRHPAHSLCSLGRAGDLSPGLELLRHLLTVFGGRAEVTSRSEVLDNGAIGGEKALGVTR